MRQPLPVNSRLLRDRRFEAWIGGPKNERDARPQIDLGRFVSLDDAMTWADVEHPTAEWVNVTLFSAATGWRPIASCQRRYGEWVTINGKALQR